MGDYYSIKTRDGDTVPKILRKEKGIVFDGINILQDSLTVGTPIFIVLGGDRPKWDTGLIGIGIISGEPFEKGYDEKNKNNFKVKIDMKVLLDKPTKRDDLIPYRGTYGIIAIGPVLKGEPNQALTTMSENQAVALMRAMTELCPNIKTDVEDLTGKEKSKQVFGKTVRMVEIPFLYGQSEKDAITEFVNGSTNENNEKSNRENFKLWLEKQVKSAYDSEPGEPYSLESIKAYVSDVGGVKININGTEKSMYAVSDAESVQKKYESEFSKEQTGHRRVSSALKKYKQFLEENQGMLNKEYVPINYRTGFDSPFERNRIVFGAPGTGKSFKLKEDSEILLNSVEYEMERVTFHPDYTYSRFVGTYKPTMTGNDITYEFVPGPFMRVYVKALKSGRNIVAQPFLLLVEEINRAKVAAVFGDMFQLLDRDEDGVSEYDIQASEDIQKYIAKELGGKPDNYSKIRIPDNMFIWATMNSADQGVFPMDTAFKRRWSFEYLGINENEAGIVGTVLLGSDKEEIVWNRLRKAINDKLAKEYKVNEDKLMGPYFLAKKLLKVDENGILLEQDKFIKTFKSKVIMYLYEDAAKQHKHKLFEGCDNSKYSSVCDAFDEIGIRIFGESFKENYYDQQEG